jgi:outer membrane protein assembly factor BamB
VALVVVLAGLAVPTSAGADPSVSFQGDVAHVGATRIPGLNPPLTARWSHTFDGLVSYPVVGDGKVFVTVAPWDHSHYWSEVYALDENSGEVVWTQAFEDTYWFQAAAYDNGRLFTIDDSANVRAFDPATGALIWTQIPPPYPTPIARVIPLAGDGVLYIAGEPAPSHGLVAFSESDGHLIWDVQGNSYVPAMDADRLYTAKPGYAAAFDRTTGTKQWEYSDGEGGGYDYAAVYGGRLYTVVDYWHGRTFDPSTGALLGTFSAGYAPAFADGVGLFLTPPPPNGSPPGPPPATLDAVDLSTGSTVWTFAGDGRLDSPPFVVNDAVYLGSGSGMIYGLDLHTGRQVWSAKAGEVVPDSDSFSEDTLTGFGAGDGLLFVPANDRLVAYAGSAGAQRNPGSSNGARLWAPARYRWSQARRVGVPVHLHLTAPASLIEVAMRTTRRPATTLIASAISRNAPAGLIRLRLRPRRRTAIAPQDHLRVVLTAKITAGTVRPLQLTRRLSLER